MVNTRRCLAKIATAKVRKNSGSLKWLDEGQVAMLHRSGDPE
jgi:hypothetical protein